MPVYLINYSILSVYFGIVLLIGYLGYKKTKQHADFVLGGRHLGPIVTAIGAHASDMSAWLMMGLPGAAYLHGLDSAWIGLALTIGAYLNWSLIAQRLRLATEKANNALTLPSFFSNYFDNHKTVIRWLTASIIFIFFTFYSASAFIAGATLFNTIFNVNYYQALFCFAVVVVTYTALGGFLAINRIDVFQGFLILFALLFLSFSVLINLGGWHASFNWLNQHSAQHLSLWPKNNHPWITLITSLSWGLGYFGQPQVLVRFMASDDPKQLTLSKWIGVSWEALCITTAVIIGLIGYVYFHHAPLKSPETVFLALAQQLMNPWIAAILFAAVLSCIMSSLAAWMMLCANALVEDIYHFNIKRTLNEQRLVWLERASIVLVAVLASCLAMLAKHTLILSMVSYAWAGVGASFGPIIFYALYSKERSGLVALCSLIFSLTTLMAWYLLHSLYPQYSLFKLYMLLPGFIAGLIGIKFGQYLYSQTQSSSLAPHTAQA